MRPAHLVLLALASTAGCVAPLTASAPLVHVEVSFSTEGPCCASYDGGPHCQAHAVDRDAPSARLDPYAGPRPAFVVVREVQGRPSNLSTTGQGVVVEASAARDGEMALASLVEGGPRLANLSWDGGEVRLDGATLAPGEPRTVERTFEVARGRAEEPLRVTERAVLTYLGEARIEMERPPWMATCR